MQITKEGLQADLELLQQALAKKTSERDIIQGQVLTVQSILTAMDKPEPVPDIPPVLTLEKPENK